MNIYSIISAVAFYIYLTLGIYVLLQNFKSKANILFFMICLNLMIWAISGFFGYSSILKKDIIFWYSIGVFSAITYYPLSLHFTVEFAGISKPRIILFSFYYFLLIIFLIKAFFNPMSILFSDIVKINNQWNFILKFNSIWVYFILSYCNSNNLIKLYLFYKMGKSSDLIRIKKQSKILLITYLTATIGTILEAVVIPSFTSYNPRGITPLFFIIWMGGVAYTIKKYKFLSITPESVSRDILSNINELIILVNKQSEIILINKKAEELLNKTNAEIINKPLKEIITEYNDLKKEIDKLISNEINSISCRINLIAHSNEKILFDVIINNTKDKFNDIIGILIIGHEVKEVKQLKTLYQLTDRQVQIIQYIISGMTNNEIASNLGIAERTIKGHITGIYDKLGVDNKIQLFNLLKDFNLIPEKNADKTVLLLKKI